MENMAMAVGKVIPIVVLSEGHADCKILIREDLSNFEFSS